MKLLSLTYCSIIKSLTDLEKGNIQLQSDLSFQVGEGKYQTPAHCGHPVLPKGGEKTEKHL